MQGHDHLQTIKYYTKINLYLEKLHIFILNMYELIWKHTIEQNKLIEH